MIGLSGNNTRGLLPILTQTIANNTMFHMSLFCGTNFTVDVGTIIQSSALLKTQAKIKTKNYYDFGLIAKEDLISFLQKHIKIPKEEELNFKEYCCEQDYKYFRRRLVTFVLEKLEKIKDTYQGNNKLVVALKKSIR